MDIAYAAPVVYPFVKGGVEKRIHEIGRRLANRGHEITIYSRHWWDGSANDTHEGMNLRAVGPASTLYSKGDRRSITSAIGLAARFLKPLSTASHDLVVTPVAPYFPVFTTRLATGLQHTPLVVTWHEVWDEYWYRYMGRSGAIGKTVELATAYLPQHAVAPSQTTARKLQQLTPGREVKVIPNGIDIEKIESVRPVTDGYNILYVGRLIEDKNVALLIKAFERCDTSARLGIIGEGPQGDSLREKAQQTAVADRIEFLGFLDDYEDVIAQMCAAEIFVSPSIREGFGITLLEAMAADCTVITVNHEHSAGSEIVGDGGFTVEPTIDGVANALNRVLAGERPAIPPTERAADYDWDVITEKTERYYEWIVGDVEGVKGC